MTIDPDKYKQMMKDAAKMGEHTVGANVDQVRDFMSQLGFDLQHPSFKFAAPMIGMVTGGMSAWLSLEQFGRVLDIALARAEGKLDPDQVYLVGEMVKPVIAKGHKPDCEDVELYAQALAGTLLIQLAASITALRSAHREVMRIEERQVLDDVRQFVMFLAKGVFTAVAQLSGDE